MEIKINETKEITVNIDFPHFTKSTISAYKILSETEVIRVGFICLSIELQQLSGHMIVDVEAISEEEFNKVYNEVESKLSPYKTI